MATAGLPVPATAPARLPPFSMVLADIGDEQSLFANLSTFSGHLKRIQVLREPHRSLHRPLPRNCSRSIAGLLPQLSLMNAVCSICCCCLWHWQTTEIHLLSSPPSKSIKEALSLVCVLGLSSARMPSSTRRKDSQYTLLGHWSLLQALQRKAVEKAPMLSDKIGTGIDLWR